ncbi:hypothetical protein [Halobacillus sp. BBL2006]|uniref:hypothetical protein n=1 Tax=Halobacillus sp. BBL2006 TaxID=1543706 RepID=UPI00054250DC|nr:hypothetical protein [Halobacillus sp. BBL2006]KHE72321.1 hypothetical protein LD39_05155 [Halobacillus sp. BBL2006]
MINLLLGIGMVGVLGLFLWSYAFDPNNSVVVSFSKKNFILTLIVLGLFTLYLLSTGIYYTFL